MVYTNDAESLLHFRALCCYFHSRPPLLLLLNPYLRCRLQLHPTLNLACFSSNLGSYEIFVPCPARNRHWYPILKFMCSKALALDRH
jgi:hypothetical protein